MARSMAGAMTETKGGKGQFFLDIPGEGDSSCFEIPKRETGKRKERPLKKPGNAPKSSAQGVKWNLKDLYSSMKDPGIERDLKKAKKLAEAFEKKYKGIFSKKPAVKPSALSQMVTDYEEILLLRDRPHIFAHLLFAGDTQNPEYGRFLQDMQTRSTDIQKHLIFVTLEWCALDEKTAGNLLKDKSLANWHHFLASARRFKPHLLSEPEEKIIEEMENTGSRAFVRLFDEMLGAALFPVKVKGKVKEMSEQEALSLLYDSDRNVRKAAAEGLTEGFNRILKPLTFIFNNLVQDHSVSDRLRKYQDPISSRNLSNEIDGKTVEALLSCCDRNTSLVSRYYSLKAKLLGLSKLYDYDRYAPISGELPQLTWKECRELVTESYTRFSPEFGKIVREFYDKNWIDAELRPGKRGGAFSASATPDVHPYILVNYSDRLRDASTVAHELGHGIHQYLSRKQGYLNADTPLTLAETASVFGEMLTFQNLLARQKSPKTRLALLCSKIEESFATVFRQVCMTRFEQKLHAERRKKGELNIDQISELWLEANRKMFGKSVELTPGYGRWWCYIPHFIHTPFYCYAYSFGELLVLALYSLYKKEGKTFVPKYTQLLSSGGSKSPEELTKRVGIDIGKPSFWNGGLKIIEGMIEEAEGLAAELSKKGKPARGNK